MTQTKATHQVKFVNCSNLAEFESVINMWLDAGNELLGGQASVDRSGRPWVPQTQIKYIQAFLVEKK